VPDIWRGIIVPDVGDENSRTRYALPSSGFPDKRVEDRDILIAMEPNLTTDPELEGVLVELSSREPIFHCPELGTTRADFERMTAHDFWETGASGRRYSRQFVLDELEKRSSTPHADVWETRDFHCRRLSGDTYLLTYTLLQDNQRLTRRATIWRSSPEGWKIVYHQGTIVQDA
jgi:hypothetical protein